VSVAATAMALGSVRDGVDTDPHQRAGPPSVRAVDGGAVLSDAAARGAAWSLLGSPESGFINQVWRALGGNGHLIDINTAYGIAWVMGVVRGLGRFCHDCPRVMKSMDPALEEASQIIGASRVRTMLRITLPLVVPGVLGAAIFVFAEMLGSFARRARTGDAPAAIMSSPRRSTHTGPAYPPNIPDRSRDGRVAVRGDVLHAVLYRRIVMAGSYVTITGKAFRPRVADHRPIALLLLGICLLYLLAAVGLPLATLLYASLQKMPSPSPPPATGRWTISASP